MSSFSRRAALRALGVLGALGAGRRSVPVTTAQRCAPGLPEEASERTTITPIAHGLPTAAPGQQMTLYRFTLPPGERIAPHSHPGATMLQIETGEMTYTVIRGVIMHWSGSGAHHVSGAPVAAGTMVTFRPGDAIFYDADTFHDAVNSGEVPVSVLAATLLETTQPQTIFDGSD